MERQIFGFTPPNPETGQPGYLAAHLVEAPEGTHVNVTVRPHAQENAAPVELALPWTEAAKLGLSIIAVSPQTHDADVNARFACELKELGLAEQEPIALDLRNVL